MQPIRLVCRVVHSENASLVTSSPLLRKQHQPAIRCETSINQQTDAAALTRAHRMLSKATHSPTKPCLQPCLGQCSPLCSQLAVGPVIQRTVMVHSSPISNLLTPARTNLRMRYACVALVRGLWGKARVGILEVPPR